MGIASAASKITGYPNDRYILDLKTASGSARVYITTGANDLGVALISSTMNTADIINYLQTNFLINTSGFSMGLDTTAHIPYSESIPRDMMIAGLNGRCTETLPPISSVPLTVTIPPTANTASGTPTVTSSTTSTASGTSNIESTSSSTIGTQTADVSTQTSQTTTDTSTTANTKEPAAALYTGTATLGTANVPGTSSNGLTFTYGAGITEINIAGTTLEGPLLKTHPEIPTNQKFVDKDTIVAIEELARDKVYLNQPVYLQDGSQTTLINAIANDPRTSSSVVNGELVFTVNSAAENRNGDYGESDNPNSQHPLGTEMDLTLFMSTGGLGDVLRADSYKSVWDTTIAGTNKILLKNKSGSTVEPRYEKRGYDSAGKPLPYFGAAQGREDATGIGFHTLRTEEQIRSAEGLDLPKLRADICANAEADKLGPVTPTFKDGYTVSTTSAIPPGVAGAKAGSFGNEAIMSTPNGQFKTLNDAITGTSVDNTDTIVNIRSIPRSDATMTDLAESYSTPEKIAGQFSQDKLKKNAYSKDVSQFSLERKIDMPAHIQIKADKSIADSAKMGKTIKDAYIDCFLLRNVRSRTEEKSHIFSSLGSEVIAFFFGKNPTVYSFSGSVIDSANQRWMDDFNYYYDNYLRGSAATKNKTRIYIIFEDQLIEGFLLNLTMDKAAEIDISANIVFDFLVTNSTVIGGYKNPDKRLTKPTDWRTIAGSNSFGRISGVPQTENTTFTNNNVLLQDLMRVPTYNIENVKSFPSNQDGETRSINLNALAASTGTVDVPPIASSAVSVIEAEKIAAGTPPVYSGQVLYSELAGPAVTNPGSGISVYTPVPGQQAIIDKLTITLPSRF